MFGEESDASITRIQRKEENMKTLKRFFKDKNAFGVVEIVLIIIVIVALIVIFRDEIMALVTKAFGTITEKTDEIVNI